MTTACPVLPPAERRYVAIQDAIRIELLRTVGAAMAEAAERVGAELAAAGCGGTPPGAAFFASVAHQHLFCTLCGADPETFESGRAEIALAIIRNSQNIAKRYLGADVAQRQVP